MSVIDILIAALFLICTVYGLVRGFVRIAIGLSGLALSLAFALRFADLGPRWFSGVFASEHFARLAAFVVVLAGGLIATAIVAWAAGRLVRAAEIGWVDRLVGGAMGAAGAMVAAAGLLVGLTLFLPAGSRVFEGSRTVPVVIGVADLAAAILPPALAQEYELRRRALDERVVPRGARGGAPVPSGRGA